MRKSIVMGITALVVCGLGLSPAAISATPSQFEDGAISVSFADLNIHKEAGARVLYARLQRASESVCNLDSYRELGSLARVAVAKECYAKALDKAVSRIDSKALKEIHAS